MKITFVALAAWVLLASGASASSTAVNCTGVNDDAAVQAAATAGGDITLQGSTCKLTAPVMITVNNTDIDLRTTVNTTASPAFVITGQEIAIRSGGRRRSIWGTNTILQLGTATTPLVSFRVENVQMNGGPCIVARNGAGLMAIDIHCNGNPAANTYSIIFRQWDTARITNFLSEQHRNGWKFEAGSWNTQASNIVLDRLSLGAAIHVAPGTGALGNIQITNLWASKGKWPFLAEVNDGQVSAVQIMPAKYSDFQDATPTVIGSGLTFYQHPYDLFTN